MTTTTLGFIGAGNMARSLVGGLLQHGHPAGRIRASDPSPDSRARMQSLGVQALADNVQLAESCDLLVLAVKPQVMREVLQPLGAAIRRQRPLLLSIAAGVPTQAICGWIGAADAAVIRAMPNTPALLGCGIAGVYANAACTAQQRRAAGAVLAATGRVEWVPEEAWLDAVTAVSGSGPAYYFLLMELLEHAGAQLGLDRELARRLAVYTALGAARMACESGPAPAELRRQVTSPGGTTEAAIAVLETAGMREIVSQAVEAARNRAVELGAELAGEPAGPGGSDPP